MWATIVGGVPALHRIPHDWDDAPAVQAYLSQADGEALSAVAPVARSAGRNANHEQIEVGKRL